jgi:hypothetical protein
LATAVDPDRGAAGQAVVRLQVLDAPLDPTAMRPTAVRMWSPVAGQDEGFAVDGAIADQFVEFVGVHGGVLAHGEVVE